MAISNEAARGIHAYVLSSFNRWYWKYETNGYFHAKLKQNESSCPNLTPYTGMNSKWLTDQNVKPQTATLPEQNTGRDICDQGLGS